MTDLPLVSVIILNYNAGDLLLNCINSLKKSTYGNLEIIVVDNISSDNSQEKCKEKFPEIKLIQNKENLGYCGGNNVGIKEAKGKFIVILNPDTIVEENAIQNMCNTLDSNSEISVVGAKIIDPDGKFQLSSRRVYPTFLTSLFQISGLSYIFPKSKLFGRYNYTYISENSTHSVDSVSGACMMFPVSLYYELKGFDERFFLYFEDTDFCYQAKKKGYKIIYNPEVSIYHHKYGSSNNRILMNRIHFYVSMFKFLFKYRSNYISFNYLFYLMFIIFVIFNLI